jgi:V/A-type H+-transporting ATPase subunit F
MHKAVVIGDYDSIYGFGALGLDIFLVEEKTEAIHQIRRLVKGSYAIIYITESLAEQIKEELENYKELITPAIILIPGVWGNTGAGIQGVKDSVEQAIGSDILFGND